MRSGRRFGARIGAALAVMLGRDANALRQRRSDRIAAWGGAALLAAFLAGAPPLALAAAHSADRTTTNELRVQRTWHQVSAVLLRTAPVIAFDVGGDSWAPARWATPSGRPRTGVIEVIPGTPRGSRVPVWVDASGSWMGSPLGHNAVLVRVLFAAVAVPAGLALALLCLATAGCWVLNWRRRAAWEADWAAVAPRWTKQFWARG